MTKRKSPETHLKKGPKPNMEECVIEGCTERGSTRSMCNRHYEKWRRTEHRERRLEQWKMWHQRVTSDPVASQEYAESRAASLAKYLEAHPDQRRRSSREYARRRRAMLYSLGEQNWTEKDVLGAYGKSCHICGAEIDLDAPRLSRDGLGWESGLHIDHVVPISRGGSNDIENVRPAHAKCNVEKGSATEGWKRGV